MPAFGTAWAIDHSETVVAVCEFVWLILSGLLGPIVNRSTSPSCPAWPSASAISRPRGCSPAGIWNGS